MSIKDWPSQERPREKLLKHGSQYLSDAELLAIFLRTGVKGKSALQIALELIENGGRLRTLLNLPCKELCKFEGIGSTKYVEFQAALELGRRYLLEQIEKGEALTSPQMTKQYLRSRLRDKPYEVFYVLFLDSKHHIIHHQELFRGTIDSASVPVREVVKEGLRHNAAAMIVAHNHPSGVAEPSLADEQLTKNLVSALRLVGIKLLDHMIVGDSDVISLAEIGKM